MNPINFLIVGADSSGLTTALTRAAHGQTNLRIIDKRREVSSSTKAIVLWAGAMQALDYLDVFNDISRRAIPLKSTSYESSSGKRSEITLSSYRSRFPHPALPIP